MAKRCDSYDFRRAEFEVDMARKAADPAAMRVHQELAALYLERFTSLAREPMTLPSPRA